MLNFLPPPAHKTIAHLAALSSENIMAGFTRAAQLGIEWVQFDVKMTANKKLVIEAGEKLLPLANALPEIIRLGLYPNIELKVPKTFSEDNTETIISLLTDAIKEHWPKDKPLPLISSTHWPLLYALRKSMPDFPIGFLADVFKKEEVERLGKLDNVSISCNYQLFTQEISELADNLGLPVLTYTVNDRLIAQVLFKAPIFAVFSNDPETLISEEKLSNTKKLSPR